MTIAAEVPFLHPLRPLLKNWVWEHGHVGTRWLDCVSGALQFDDGKKARFATGPMVHVALRCEFAADALHAAPVTHEGALARFLRAAQLGQPAEAGTVAEQQRAVQDCIDLALQCALQREARAAQQKLAQEALFDDEIRAAVAEQLRSHWVALREQLALYDWTVFHGLPAALMISESPFLDWRVRAQPPQPFVSLPLGPYCLLVGTPSGKKSVVGPVLWKAVSAMGPFKDHNALIATDARAWLVAIADDMLLAVQERRFPQAVEDGPPPARG